LLSQFAEQNLKLNAKVPTQTRVQLNFGLSTYLDHTLRLSLSEITSLFGLSGYLDRTFAQRTGSAKVKSKNEATHCMEHSLLLRYEM